MSWEVTGNLGTNPNVNFLGTSDAQPLVIKTNGQEVYVSIRSVKLVLGHQIRPAN
jgi:hypothetical protein